MKLFFIGWQGSDLGLTDAARNLKTHHEISYWSGDGKEFESLRAEFPGTIFHDHFDALYGIPPAGIDASAFPPPDAALLLELLKTESIVLTMMNKRFESALTSERKHLYYTLVRYWRGVLLKLRPDAIIFPCAPHTVYDYVIYGLAKHLGIRCIMFELTVVGARSIVMEDYEVGSATLAQRIAHAKTESRKEARDLPPDIREYYEWQMNPEATHTPLYMRQQLGRYAGLKKVPIKFKSVWDTLVVHKDLRALGKVLTHIPRRLMRNMRTEYISLQTAPDFAQKFIYAPLSFQPERTSSPQGGVFVDQLLMIEMLSASVPEDWLIYVKEHPAQWLHRGPDFFSYRYRGYYESIARLKNVKLVPVDTDTFTLTNHSRALATVTGTAGFEAIFRGKSVLIFGFPWYLHAPGLFRVSSVSEIKAAISTIISGFAPSREAVLQYLYCLGKQSFVGYCEHHGRDMQYLSASQNAEVLAEVIETELQELKL